MFSKNFEMKILIFRISLDKSLKSAKSVLTSNLKLDRDTDLYYSTKNRAFISLKISFNEPSTTK